MRTQLLCTFTNEAEFESVLENIQNSFILYSRKIFILKLKPSQELVISYNIIPNNERKFLGSTILAHRKKESNTIYTINALNEVIRSKNNGVLDKSFNVEWSEYQNSLLLTKENGLYVVPTKIYKIVNVKEWDI